MECHSLVAEMMPEFCIPGESTPDSSCSVASVFGNDTFDLAEPHSHSRSGLGRLENQNKDHRTRQPHGHYSQIFSFRCLYPTSQATG